MEAEMTVAIVSLVRWRRSRKRICRQAAKLLAENGDHAFFQAAKLAGQARGDDCQAQFWQAVCSEVRPANPAKERVEVGSLTEMAEAAIE
jgi:hypothetical protein